MIAILIYFITMSITSIIFHWKNFRYNKKIYNTLSKMIFVNEEPCIKGFLPEHKSAFFYYWKDTNSFTLDSNANIFLHKPSIFTSDPYNYYWFVKFKKFILKQKTYTFSEFYSTKESLFSSLKKEEVLSKLLND